MIAVIIPCYDCAVTIAAVVEAIPAAVDRIILVDDGNRPPTKTVLASLVGGRVELVRHDRNQGVGAAMASGYRRALDVGALYLIKMDADGQMHPGQIPGMVKRLTYGAHYVKGTRWPFPWELRRMGWTRRLGVAGLAWWLGMPDPVNGYTGITRSALQSVDWERIDPRYGFELSMLLEARRLGWTVDHIPMAYREGSGVSHLSPLRCLLTFPRLLLR